PMIDFNEPQVEPLIQRENTTN
ncbi:exporting protein, partial [Campylobacter coli]